MSNMLWTVEQLLWVYRSISISYSTQQRNYAHDLQINTVYVNITLINESILMM